MIDVYVNLTCETCGISEASKCSVSEATLWAWSLVGVSQTDEYFAQFVADHHGHKITVTLE